MVVLAVVSRGLLSRRLRLILDVSFFVCLWMDVQMIYLAFFPIYPISLLSFPCRFNCGPVTFTNSEWLISFNTIRKNCPRPMHSRQKQNIISLKKTPEIPSTYMQGHIEKSNQSDPERTASVATRKLVSSN